MEPCIMWGCEDFLLATRLCKSCSPPSNSFYPKFGFDEDADEYEDDYGNYSKYRNY